MTVFPRPPIPTDAARDFTETDGASTYVATVDIPAGAKLDECIWTNEALWTASGSASLTISDGGFNIISGCDLKVRPAAGHAISSEIHDFSFHSSGAYYPSGATLTATVTTVGATGHAGRSHLFVSWSFPAASVSAAKT